MSNCESLAGRNYLFRAHEEEMLHGVGHSWHVICIAKASDIDIDSSARFVSIRIVDEKGFELVRKSDDSVGSVIKRWGVQLVSDALYGSHTGQGACV